MKFWHDGEVVGYRTETEAAWTCPKCGSAAGFSVSRRVNGWESWAYYATGRPAVEICDDHNVRRTWPKTGVCFSCDRRVPIPTRAVLPDASAQDA